jgi:EAL domain-containing protein (putative c-di-GMP-specific phosphodiesterase class I)/ActR/RegA family two-component response regulator
MSGDELNFLVVDDDDLLRVVTKKMLSRYTTGEILEAPDGNKALEILHEKRAKKIDIVFCDLNMPGMDGMEFLRHLGEEHSDVAVVVISSLEDALVASVKKMAVAYGIRLLGSIPKPIVPPQIEAIIQQYKDTGPAQPATLALEHVFTLEEIQQGIRDNQFEPFFQPKADFKTGRISGAEALARWVHPQHGIIIPRSFIPQLEAGHAIDELTLVILKKASEACRILHEKGYPITISVNLSTVSLSNSGLANIITQTVQQAGVDPKYITLEVTESAAMSDVAHSLENLARLRMHGFGLSVDDYGTGSSNIQNITRVAFNELKIDQSFVKNCINNLELCVVNKSSIKMAHQLKMECIAEGVETQQDWDALKDMSCDTAQGYFIGKPMSFDSFLSFYASYVPKTVSA